MSDTLDSSGHTVWPITQEQGDIKSGFSGGWFYAFTKSLKSYSLWLLRSPREVSKIYFEVFEVGGAWPWKLVMAFRGFLTGNEV